MESPYPRNTTEKPIGILKPLVPTPSIDGPVFMAIAWALWGVALIMVISRIVDTQRRSKKYGIEAWFSMGSFVLLSIALSFAMVSFKEGLDYVVTFVVHGKDGQTRRNHVHRIMFISSTIFTVLYPITLWVSKAAILFASRVLILHLPQYHAMFWSIVALEMVSFMVYFVLLFAPYNILIIWTTFDYPILQERSSTLRTIYIVQVVLDIFTDLLAMILPCRLLPGLKIALWKKIMAIVVFTLGVVIIIFASLRIVVLLRSFHAQFPAVQASVQVLTWSQLQLAMSSIVANAPALRNLIQYKINRFQEKRRRRGRRNRNRNRNRSGTKRSNWKGKSNEETTVNDGLAAGAETLGSVSNPNVGGGVRRKRDSFEKLGFGLISMTNDDQLLTSMSLSTASLHHPPSSPHTPAVNFTPQHTSSTTLLDGATGEPQEPEFGHPLRRYSSSMMPRRPSSAFTSASTSTAHPVGNEGNTYSRELGIELAQWPSSRPYTTIGLPLPSHQIPRYEGLGRDSGQGFRSGLISGVDGGGGGGGGGRGRSLGQDPGGSEHRAGASVKS